MDRTQRNELAHKFMVANGLDSGEDGRDELLDELSLWPTFSRSQALLVLDALLHERKLPDQDVPEELQHEIAFHAFVFETWEGVEAGHGFYELAEEIIGATNCKIVDATELIVAAIEHKIRIDIGSRHHARWPTEQQQMQSAITAD